jgi:type IV pilus assembly protein PilV
MNGSLQQIRQQIRAQQRRSRQGDSGRGSSRPHCARQAGAGLIEVLVALLISAFALLGLAGMQASSLRYQKVADFRALASHYAGNMADRIRANLPGARAGAYGFAQGQYSATPPAAPDANPCDGSEPAACSSQTLASRDLYEWQMALAQGLAGGWGEVSGDVHGGFVVRVYFREPGYHATASDPNCPAGGGSEVRCFSTVVYP